MATTTRRATRRRWIFWAGLGVVAAGVWVIAPHAPGTQGKGLRTALWIPLFGVWWSDADAQRLMEGAGSVDGSVPVLALATKVLLFRGITPAG